MNYIMQYESDSNSESSTYNITTPSINKTNINNPHIKDEDQIIIHDNYPKAYISNKINIGNITYEKVELNQSIFNTYDKPPITSYSYSEKEYSKKIRKQRQKYGDPSSIENFHGTWGRSFIHNEDDVINDEKIQIDSFINKGYIDKNTNRYNYDVIPNDNTKHNIKPDEEVLSQKEPYSISYNNEFQSDKNSFLYNYIYPQSHIKPNEFIKCYIPKRHIFTFKGHSKQVNKIKLFPKNGHLLLSSSTDSQIKLWDSINSKKCLFSYIGHAQSVKDICFSDDGLKFVSIGLDCKINLWDIETGKAIFSINNKKLPFCCQLPSIEVGIDNVLLVGTVNRSIIQYDTRTKEIAFCYDEHIGAVNTLTFVNEKKFASTSDDKKLFIWEMGIDNPYKRISDPSVQSITAIVKHPIEKSLVGQTIDNKVIVYDYSNQYKINKKKVFSGHLTSGYSCGVDISPDGQFLVSGDSNGGIWFWDWKTTKNYRVVEGHSKVVSDVKWHPLMQSKLYSSSFDGLIKLWD